MISKNIWILYEKSTDKFFLDSWYSLDNINIEVPLSIWWLVTWRCNLNCLHCYWNEEELPKDIGSKDLMIIANKMVKSWIKRVSISWWEPTIRKDLFDIIDTLDEWDVSVILSTNWLFVKENINELKKLRHIEISLDWGNENIHDIFRPSRWWIKWISFNNAIAWIDSATESWILTRVLTTVNIFNKDELFNIWNILNNLWVNEWHIWRTVNAGRARFMYNKLNDFNFDENIITNLKEKYPKLKIQFNYPSKSSNYYVLILPNGNITTQNNITWEKIELWSLVKNNIEDFWNEKNYDKKWHLIKWLNIK